MQERVAEGFLQALDLLAHCRLGAVNAFPRAGEAAGVDDRYEAAQKVEIEHERSIHLSTGIQCFI